MLFSQQRYIKIMKYRGHHRSELLEKVSLMDANSRACIAFIAAKLLSNKGGSSVYDHTGSLLVAILMHLSLTASTLIIQPLAPSRMPGLTYSLVLAAALWVFVAVVQWKRV